jgi:exodeoxyribonuclease V gamma subunit
MGFRLSKISARDILTLWVRHLVLNAIAPDGIARTSLWVGEDKTICLGPVEDANGLLQELLAIYWQGLHRVLPFFPKSALAYANALGRGRDHPLRAARQEWLGNEFSLGECQDPYFDLCYRGLDPLDDEFTRLAQAVFGPALKAMKDQQ